jgi:hypothetical protein
MATNKLMEAAADILSQSKKAAPAMPMQKPEDSTSVDLGGPKQDVGSNKVATSIDDIYNHYKMDAAKAAKSATAPTTKPSNASPDKQDTLKKVSEEEEIDDEVIAEEEISEEQENIVEAWKKKMKEDVDALFSDDSTISEDFKSKAATIFEARVTDRVQQIEEEIDAKYAEMLEEAVGAIQADLTEKVDDYLNYVVEQWMEENQIAIESSLRSELTEEFIGGLRNLFAEHYIDVPEDKVDLVDELAGQVEELETKLNEEIERGIEIRKQLIESVKTEITYEVCDGLTDTQVEKIKSLAESVEFSTEDEYRTKLETIRENYFPSGVKKADEQQLHEEIETDEKVVATDAFVAAVSKAITRTTVK